MSMAIGTLILADHSDGVATVARFADHAKLRICLEQLSQRFEEDGAAIAL